MANYEDDFVLGPSGGGTTLPDSPETRTNKIITIDELIKKSMYVWGGNYSSSELNSLFKSTNYCPTKSVILNSNYNKRDIIEIDSSNTYGNSKCVVIDDVNPTNTYIITPVNFYADSSLNLNVNSFEFTLFLSNNNTSISSVYKISTRTIDKINKGTTEPYNISLRLTDMNNWENPFNRDSCLCGSITVDWNYTRDIYYSVEKANGVVVVGEQKDPLSIRKGTITWNFGITWRECIANDYRLHVRIAPN